MYALATRILFLVLLACAICAVWQMPAWNVLTKIAATAAILLGFTWLHLISRTIRDEFLGKGK